MKKVLTWSLRGFADQPIYGNTHLPSEGKVQRGAVLLAHGFKGYKDYGMFPCLARFFASEGFIAHRFNFSHSGVTEAYDTFEKPELFELDSYNKQVFDLRQLIKAMNENEIPGRNLPCLIFGHSRGGVTVLLTAGRMAAENSPDQPAAVISAAAPAGCNNFSARDQTELIEKGFLLSPSSRTGQTLRIDKGFLTEQLEEPEAHDLLKLAQNIKCPALILHGTADETVPPEAAERIYQAIPHSHLKLIEGANHVFNIPNPMPDDMPYSQEFQDMLDAIREFINSDFPV